MGKIPYEQFLRMLHNPEIDDAELRPYITVEQGSGPFSPNIVPNPDTVEVSANEAEAASAMRIGNAFSRWRRHTRFKRRRALGTDLPVVVTEGDSWFQFPLLVSEVVDQLYDDYLIWDIAAAGDTLANIGGPNTEYMDALRRFKGDVTAFMFSAAGNDVIGEDKNGVPALLALVKPFDPSADAAGHIEDGVFEAVLSTLKSGYENVIAEVRAEPGFEALPIIVHGYDYSFAWPADGDEDTDPRQPRHASCDAWLGSVFKERKIEDPTLRQAILHRLVDALYDMLNEVAGDSRQTHVHVVDCRGAMPGVEDWIDEIHGTDDGFEKVAARFKRVLDSVTGRSPAA